MKHKIKLAFTLVEILVVMIIITILVGIILAVLPAVRRRAQLAGCKSNLQQIATALRQYWQDNRAYPPPPLYYNQANNEYTYEYDPNSTDLYIVAGGLQSLRDYLRAKEVFVCQADNNPNRAKDANYSTYNELYNFWGYQDTLFGPPITSCRYARENMPDWGKHPDEPCAELSCDDPTAPCFDPSTGWHRRLTTPGNYEYAGLCNPDAPDRTIITRCKHHRNWFKPAREVALRLSGSISELVVSREIKGKLVREGWDLPYEDTELNINYNTHWHHQPEE